MDEIWHNSVATAHQNKLLETLQCLLTIRATSVRTAMTEAADLLAPVLGTDKVDSMFYDPSIDSLVALGSSNTVMGRRQQEIGMDRLPLANGGRIVDVFQTGEPCITGRADEDPAVLQGFTHGLGIWSLIADPCRSMISGLGCCTWPRRRWMRSRTRTCTSWRRSRGGGKTARC